MKGGGVSYIKGKTGEVPNRGEGEGDKRGTQRSRAYEGGGKSETKQ